MNHLIKEKSPYLLQHADNPVFWYAWGAEAFERAHKEQKPILLSIGYSTCHWCHVMAHESFEDEQIAKVMNDLFICIKVDREERPDIDHIYMSAVSSMTGQGGWPLTVFLTPAAKPFYGGTYFPPYAKWGSPGFNDLLMSIAQAWHNDPDQIATSAKEIVEALMRQKFILPLGNDDIVLTKDILNAAFKGMMAQFDPTYGGFGHAPKFPMGHNLSFLLRYYQKTKDEGALNIVEQTLKAMSAGGIWDHLGGGFHRYATDRQWHVPHFEKMLYDQALLVLAYTECYQVTGRAEYAKTVHENLQYVLRDLTSTTGAFFCAEDADTGGKEGAFYVFKQEEIFNLLTKEEADCINRYYGIHADGNVGADPHGEFIGTNILVLVESVNPQDASLLTLAKSKLFAYRTQRPRPHLDDKVLTDWNGLMIGAMSFGGVVLNEERYIQSAINAAEFILKHLKVDGRLYHRWRENETAIEGMLEDYAFFIFGLIHLYEITFEQRYLGEAIALADVMIELFEDKINGGFFMTKVDSNGLFMRPMDIYDGALPSGNSVAAYVLMKLHFLTHNEAYQHHAEKVFKRFMPNVRSAPHAYAFLMTALDLYLYPPLDIVLHGACDESYVANLRKMVYKHFIPHKVFKRKISQSACDVQICRDGACMLPETDLAKVERKLL